MGAPVAPRGVLCLALALGLQFLSPLAPAPAAALSFQWRGLQEAAAPAAGPAAGEGGAPSATCPPFRFRGKDWNYPNCVELDTKGEYKLWWRVNKQKNFTNVAFEGATENPYTWSSWGVATEFDENGYGRMNNSYVLIGYADQRAYTNGEALVRSTGNIFYLPGIDPRKFKKNVKKGPIKLVNKTKPSVEFVDGGNRTRIVAMVEGLTNGSQVIIWRGGASVILFDDNLLGTHTDRSLRSRTIDFVAGNAAPAPPPANGSVIAPPSTDCAPFEFRGGTQAYERCATLDSAGMFKLWWTVDNATNVTTVAFQGATEVVYTWSSWGVATVLEDGYGVMDDALAFVAFADTRAAESGNASPASQGQLMLLRGTRAANFELGPTNGVVAVASGGTPEVEFIDSGKSARMVVNVTGLTVAPQVIIWKAGSAMEDYEASRIGDHKSKARESLMIDFVGGAAAPAPPPASTSNMDQKVIHAWLAGLGFGVLLPLGILVARHVKVWLDPLWFYSHMGLQICGYLAGVIGWSYGIWLKTKYPDISTAPANQFAHYAIGITIFTIATLQVLTPVVKPHKGAPVRLFWNITHWTLGYGTIFLSFANVFLGFGIMEEQGISYGGWESGYIAFAVVWGVLMLALEPLSWWRYNQKKGDVTDDEEDDDYEGEEGEEEEDEEGDEENGYEAEKPKKNQRNDDDDDEDEEEEDEDDDDDDKRNKLR